jgi:hypothetical protein
LGKMMDIATLRLVNQQIAGNKCNTPKDIVGWMGAMQAQDFGMVKWAIGVRLADSTHHDIEAAINQGEILRTHLLRPTWHFVSADDIRWMLELTAPRILAASKSRHLQLGLTPALVSKSLNVIEKSLAGGVHKTREALISELEGAGIPTDENRASHLLLRAELDGLICSGKIEAGKPKYALLDDRIPKKEQITKEEALARLARTYFTSHGPATIQDFSWWSGLSAKDCQWSVELVKGKLISEQIEKLTYWFTDSLTTPGEDPNAFYLLPAYDEYLIGYSDRSAVLPAGAFTKVVSNNGIFRPVVVVGGRVAGVWKRVIKKEKVRLEVGLFDAFSTNLGDRIDKAGLLYGLFLEKDIEISTKGAKDATD